MALLCLIDPLMQASPWNLSPQLRPVPTPPPPAAAAGTRRLRARRGLAGRRIGRQAGRQARRQAGRQAGTEAAARPRCRPLVQCWYCSDVRSGRGRVPPPSARGGGWVADGSSRPYPPPHLPSLAGAGCGARLEQARMGSGGCWRREAAAARSGGGWLLAGAGGDSCCRWTTAVAGGRGPPRLARGRRGAQAMSASAVGAAAACVEMLGLLPWAGGAPPRVGGGCWVGGQGAAGLAVGRLQGEWASQVGGLWHGRLLLDGGGGAGLWEGGERELSPPAAAAPFPTRRYSLAPDGGRRLHPCSFSIFHCSAERTEYDRAQPQAPPTAAPSGRTSGPPPFIVPATFPTRCS